ncbi:MAG: PIN domain-containing protein [Treponema sp.]|nr:PIN domain-containing protein [Treponema sp.]
MSQLIYLLDTNIISEPTKAQASDKVIQKLAENLEYSGISSIVWAETLTGVKQLPDGKRKTGLFDYLVQNVQKMYEIIPFDASCASIYSDLAQKLNETGSPAPQFDLLIAATAIANNLILVTRNTQDFETITKVSNLMIENWFEG